MNPDDMKPAYHDIMEALGNKQVISLISQNKANTFPFVWHTRWTKCSISTGVIPE